MSNAPHRNIRVYFHPSVLPLNIVKMSKIPRSASVPFYTLHADLITIIVIVTVVFSPKKIQQHQH